MAAKQKRKLKQVLDLSAQTVEVLATAPDYPGCFGSYEAEYCTGEFCAHCFEKCQKDSENARSTTV